ncbi:MAG: GHKL domain-containing protein [Lachnospiraceae bacterium]|nr:GHKL domain-containing protein [Lachnospiraceae bacterium]
MAAILFSILINACAGFNILLIMQYIFSGHTILTDKQLGISALLCLLSVTIPEFLPFAGTSWVSLFVFLGPVLSVLFLSRKRLGDLSLLLPSIALYFATQIIPEFLLSCIFPSLEKQLTVFGVTSTPATLFGDFILLVVLLALRHVLKKYQFTMNLSGKEIVGAMFLFFFCFADAFLLRMVELSVPSGSSQIIWKLLIFAALIFGILYYFYLLAENRIRIYRESMAFSEKEYLKSQLSALQDVKENEEETRRMRHDIKNHLAVIETLCESRKYDEVRSYVEKLSGSFSPSGKMLTGNQIADSIVNQKMKIATEAGIDFSFQGNFSSLEHMDGPDICGLLANAYDNAIEACLGQENAYIRTSAAATKNYITIEIRNSVAKKIRISNNRVTTTKADRNAHGYGLEIMKRIAGKYHGKCAFFCSDTEFSVTIFLLT